MISPGARRVRYEAMKRAAAIVKATGLEVEIDATNFIDYLLPDDAASVTADMKRYNEEWRAEKVATTVRGEGNMDTVETEQVETSEAAEVVEVAAPAEPTPPVAEKPAPVAKPKFQGNNCEICGVLIPATGQRGRPRKNHKECLEAVAFALAVEKAEQAAAAAADEQASEAEVS